MADAYATKVYPALSYVLSWLSSFTRYNLEEFAIAAIIITVLAVIVMGIILRWGFVRCLRYEATILLWTYLWFNIGWSTNYTRSNLYERTGAEYQKYDEEKFLAFTHQFVEDLNDSWVSMPIDAESLDSIYDLMALENEIKAFYASVPSNYGLAKPHSWQHPKRIICNRFYSSVGVLGFMAPLFSESCLNADIPSFDYPFIYAHEYAHLLGVSDEAEANWWAYHACVRSENPKVRYSAYKGILQHVLINSQRSLSERQFSALKSSLRPEVVEDYNNTHWHWNALLSPVLNDIQSKIYDTYLKSNNIEAGIQNYTQVVGLLINIEYEN